MYKVFVNKTAHTVIENDINTLGNAKAVVTIGNFDGIHCGHLALFKELQTVANKYNYRKIAITFEPLPGEYFADVQSCERLSRLSLLRDKYLLLSQAGVIDELVVLHFNAFLMQYSPAQFIANILIKRLNTAHVVVGDDFHFGYKASGDVTDFANFNIAVSQLPAYYLDDCRISSSLIRTFAANNDLINVKRYLGHNIQYTSRIIHGNKLGRKLGVPTINLSIGRNRPALWGVYLAYVYIDNIRYNAIASIGKHPTISGDLAIYKLEAHLLDVNLDLYGKIATIEVLAFMREQLKFTELAALVKQMQQDLQDARHYFLKTYL